MAKIPAARKAATTAKTAKTAETYDHKDKELLLRPDVGLQAQFRKKKPPKTYRFDSSLDPNLSWDISADREKAESLIAQIETASSQFDNTTDPAEASRLASEIRCAAAGLKRLSQPFLNWAGKAEHVELSVPTLPLFVHERLSTQAILESVGRHKRDKQMALDLFQDTNLDIADRILRAYEH